MNVKKYYKILNWSIKNPKKLSLLWDIFNCKELNDSNTFIIDDLDEVSYHDQDIPNAYKDHI